LSAKAAPSPESRYWMEMTSRRMILAEKLSKPKF
jgi:hypothetical protein